MERGSESGEHLLYQLFTADVIDGSGEIAALPTCPTADPSLAALVRDDNQICV